MTDHQKYMQQALELARKGEGRTTPNPPVGAIVVRGGRIVGRGFHPKAGQPHAEIFALREAGDQAEGADLYVTLEPCSHQGRTGPCCEAVALAGINRVFVGCLDPNPQVSGRGIAYLEQQGREVESGLLESECRRLISPFAKHVTTGLPLVILKSAITLDGFTACASGDSQWVSGEASRTHVHRLRDCVDAIMVGIGTVEHDDPRLTTRLEEGGRDPLRVVVDSSLRIDESAAILNLDSEAATLIATTDRAPTDKARRLEKKGIELLRATGADGQVDLTALLRHLGQRQIQSVLLEGGASLSGSALKQGLVDRVMVFVAPKLLGGGDGLGIFAGKGVTSMADALHLEDVRTSRLGDDLLIEGEIRHVHRTD